MDNVFIAWSRNRSLADKVGDRLKVAGLNPIIGGGLPRDMFIGSQVMSQMDSCNFAVILAQKKEEILDIAEFSDNIMFEWGYLIAKLSNRKVFVFLIDTSERELPSDLIGSWILPISTEGKTEDELADEIASQLSIESDLLDKIDIVSKWRGIKNILSDYNVQHKYTDLEIAQFALFSAFSAFYFDDLRSYIRICQSMETRSPDLLAVLTIVRNKVQIYEHTNNLSKPLEIEDFYEIYTALNHEYEEVIQSEDLRQWAKIIRIDAISLATYMISQGLDEDSRAIYIQESIDLGLVVLDLIDENLAQHPENLHFAELLRGLQYRNIAISYKELGNPDQAHNYFEKSAEVREALYFFYKNSNSPDSLLSSKFGQEYYLAQLERCSGEMSPLEKQRIKMTVKKYLNTWEAEFVRQQSLLQMVKDAYANIE